MYDGISFTNKPVRIFLIEAKPHYQITLSFYLLPSSLYSSIDEELFYPNKPFHYYEIQYHDTSYFQLILVVKDNYAINLIIYPYFSPPLIISLSTIEKYSGK